MDVENFVNYYSVLGVRRTAGSHAIERKFRQLAIRHHPDNQVSGDRAQFESILEAYKALRDAGTRARYDLEHDRQLSAYLPVDEEVDDDAGGTEDRADGASEAVGDDFGIERDLDIQNSVLTLLYLRRRTNIRQAGIGDAELEFLSGCSEQQLEFHLWYLKEKGWIVRGDDGLIAITVEGVDRAALHHNSESTKRITDQT